MRLNHRAFGDWRRIFLFWLAAAFLLGHVAPLHAQTSSMPSVTWKVCERPHICFKSKEDRQAWAKEHSCQFLEDVCEKAPASSDNKGAKPEDKGFWGSLWDSVKSGLVYGYEFVKGLLSGLKDQVTGIVDLVLHIDEVLGGLVDLGKAFYGDPKGTLIKLAEILGQDVIDNLTKATMCGPYDLGKVIGQNVSPVTVAKLASKISKYGGDLTKAIKVSKLELGCASFAAGTPVLTPSGPVPIERVAQGQLVQSRNVRGFADADQPVVKLFGRKVDHYRSLTTEFDTFNVTDEHPLWLQGKGWAAVETLQRGDVIATAGGDVTVLSNERIEQPIQVYNFSVDKTSSYFVGHGVWAHNTSCDLGKDWLKLAAKEKGFRAEMEVASRLEMKGYKRVGNTFDPTKYPNAEAAMKAWDGQTGIDGIFKNAKGEYVIVESKGKGVSVKDEVAGCVDKLCPTKKGRQMSEEWIDANLDKLVTDPVEAKKIRDGLASGNTKRVYAQTDGDATIFNEIITPGTDLKAAEIGKTWHP